MPWQELYSLLESCVRPSYHVVCSVPDQGSMVQIPREKIPFNLNRAIISTKAKTYRNFGDMMVLVVIVLGVSGGSLRWRGHIGRTLVVVEVCLQNRRMSITWLIKVEPSWSWYKAYNRETKISYETQISCYWDQFVLSTISVLQCITLLVTPPRTLLRRNIFLTWASLLPFKLNWLIQHKSNLTCIYFKFYLP